MGTVEPRCKAAMRHFKGWPDIVGIQYEILKDLIMKYGCPVDKVSDGKEGQEFWVSIYFQIPKDVTESFLEEEVRQYEGATKE